MLSKNQVKYLHSLRQGKFRDLNRVFIAEGVKLVEDLIASNFSIQRIYATPEWTDTHQRIIANAEFVVEEISQDELARISNLVSPNEVVAVVGYADHAIPSPEKMGDIILMLDRLQDPGNFGTIIRTADWFGIRHIICSNDTVDVYNPKVIQATMGSICRVNIHYTDLMAFIGGLPDIWHTYGTLSGGEDIYTTKLEFPAAIMIGNESKGIAEEYIPLLSGKLGIPSRSSGAESLNASVAAGIICSEFSRRL